MIHRGTQILPFDSMGCPRSSHRWIFLDDDVCVRRGERRGVVIERPMQLCIPRKFGVHSRLSEQVESEDGVWDKLAPKMKREVLVITGNPRDEMSLGSPDCLLR